ncbi:MAG: 3-isopropylmalate dehydratase small subunit, partial [Pseudomonadota bacterium]
VDTDMIIPKQCLKTIKRTGLGKSLFLEARYDEHGNENPDFILNIPPYRDASILIANSNFGCGSSREHAPWALLDFGIKCIIAPSFADIFYNNCFKNGILPIILDKEKVDQLRAKSNHGANANFDIDLVEQKIIDPDGQVTSFDIDPFRKQCLLQGHDDVAITLMQEDVIEAYEHKLKSERNWLFNSLH